MDSELWIVLICAVLIGDVHDDLMLLLFLFSLRKKINVICKNSNYTCCQIISLDYRYVTTVQINETSLPTNLTVTWKYYSLK